MKKYINDESEGTLVEETLNGLWGSFQLFDSFAK